MDSVPQPHVEILNVFATFNVGKLLNIQEVCHQLLPAANPTGPLNYFCLRIRSESVLVRIFDSGKAVVYEAKSLENCYNGAKKAAQVIRNLTGSGFHNYRVISIIGTYRLRRDINLGYLARKNSETMFYSHKQDCNTAKCDLPCFGTVIRVHKSGPLIVIGKDLVKMDQALLSFIEMAEEIWQLKQ